MKTVIVISPDYLTAVSKESNKYSFVIQGYGNFELALKGITKVNSCDLLGIGYVGYSLPLVGTKELENMISFLKLCSMFEQKKRMVFITQTDASRLRQYVADLENIQIAYFDNKQEITDTLINQNLFGTILYATMTPYIFDDAVRDDLPEFRMQENLKLPAVFSKNCELLLNHVDVLQTDIETLENDETYQFFVKRGDKVFQMVRQYQVSELFHKATMESWEKLMTVIDQNVIDVTDWCFLYTLFDRSIPVIQK